MARRLQLNEMTPESNIEGSWMSSEILPNNVFLKCVREMVEGVTDLGFLSQPPMRLTQGYISLVSTDLLSHPILCF